LVEFELEKEPETHELGLDTTAVLTGRLLRFDGGVRLQGGTFTLLVHGCHTEHVFRVIQKLALCPDGGFRVNGSCLLPGFTFRVSELYVVSCDL